MVSLPTEKPCAVCGVTNTELSADMHEREITVLADDIPGIARLYEPTAPVRILGQLALCGVCRTALVLYLAEPAYRDLRKKLEDAKTTITAVIEGVRL